MSAALVDSGRRRFLRGGAALAAASGVGLLATEWWKVPETSTLIQVPEGFTPRIVARSGHCPAIHSGYRWHPAPDGGGCFAAGDGGWIYVSNREEKHEGGVGALRFDAAGQIVDAYPVLAGTRQNCAGGVTPWGSWLSCEEVGHGLVWECDPLGLEPGLPLPALGVFAHEAAAVDPRSGRIYLTEDEKDGGIYRFTPPGVTAAGRPVLEQGLLEIACLEDSRIVWAEVPDPGAGSRPLREQVPAADRFRGAEGIAIDGGMLRFTTKWDNGIWQLDLADNRLELLYRMPGPSCSVDNLQHTPAGDMLLAEEGSGMRILYFPRNQTPPVTLLRIPGHRDSEITGLAFDPGGTRLYFSSQRGSTGKNEHGMTFELSGDFASLGRDPVLTEWVLDHPVSPA